MSSRQEKAEKERIKQIQEKCQTLLTQMLRDEDNKYCVDCDAKGPRWASWNIGIFLCIRCAGIHRNLGVHISKVKSVNLDSWTPEQVALLQQMGNSRARAVYEANLPDNFRRPQTDSSLEAFIRAKYEQKKYIAKEWVPPPAPKPAFEIEVDDKKKEKKSKSSQSKGIELSSAKPKSNATGSSTPPPAKQVEAAPATQTNKRSAAVDLLGLDEPASGGGGAQQSDDPFGSFLQGPSPANAPASDGSSSNGVVKQEKAPTTTSQRSGEEENFFNQTAGEDASRKQQFTKESILSLYGQGGPPPPQPQAYPGMYMGQQPGMYAPVQGVPMGMPYQQVPVPVANGALPVQNIPGGMIPQYSVQPQSQPQQQPPGMATNPFFAPGAGFYATNMMPAAALGQSTSMPVSKAELMWDYGNVDFGNPRGAATNPDSVAKLQQQMASMSMNGGGVPSMAYHGVNPAQMGMMVPPGQDPGATAQYGPNPGWGAQQPARSLSTNLWQ